MAGLFKNYAWLQGIKATSVAFGVEPQDFEYVRRHPRRNPLFTPKDGLIHMSYVGRGGPDMIAALRALFTAVQSGREKVPELYKALRIHFVGTTYAPNAEGKYQVLPVARECGVEDMIQENPQRVQHLDAIQILLDSDALLVLGSESPHYTASKLFPYILAAKPLLAVFHEESSAVKLLEETRAGKAITFSAARPPLSVVGEIEAALHKLLDAPAGVPPTTDWKKLEPFTARAVTARPGRGSLTVLCSRRSDERFSRCQSFNERNPIRPGIRQCQLVAAVPRPAATRVFIPLVTPFLYGMERAVIELFDALRPEVEPYFLQSNRIFERRPPIIEEMIRRGFSMEQLYQIRQTGSVWQNRDP